MQTKTATQFQQHYTALLDLLLPKKCPLCWQFCFDHGLCADCWHGAGFYHSIFLPMLIFRLTPMTERGFCTMI
jgi:hypothetical protein